MWKWNVYNVWYNSRLESRDFMQLKRDLTYFIHFTVICAYFSQCRACWGQITCHMNSCGVSKGLLHLYVCSASLAITDWNIACISTKVLHPTRDVSASPVNANVSRNVWGRSIGFSPGRNLLSRRSHSFPLQRRLKMVKHVWCHAIGGRLALMSPRGAEQNPQFSMSPEKAWGKAYLGTMT